MTADRPDLRAQMLTDATAHRDAIYDARHDAINDRDKLRDELRTITAELQDRITAKVVEVADFTRQAHDADALVRSLTPRKARTTKPVELSGFGQSGTIDVPDVDTDQ